MREKLLVLMKNEGLTSSRLAELLGIQPSGISHILAGRNKPSFDLVQKILRRFPRVNPDWLLLDNEQMYRDITTNNSQSPEIATLPESSESTPEQTQNNVVAKTTAQQPIASAPTQVNNIAQSAALHGNVKRIIILYQDRTFESYEVERI